MSQTIWLWASRALAALTVAVVAVLFITAGELVQSHRLEDVHGAAAIALHVVLGALALAMVGLARQRRSGWWAVGLAAAAFLTRTLDSLLFGVRGRDPLTFAGVAVVLLSAAAFACLAPARRAARSDPIVTLRGE